MNAPILAKPRYSVVLGVVKCVLCLLRQVQTTFLTCKCSYYTHYCRLVKYMYQESKQQIRKASGISLIAYPKINLALDILSKVRGGYHLMRTVFHELKGSIFDEIYVESSDDGSIEIETDNTEIPCDEGSLLYRAAHDLRRKNAVTSGAKIFVKKRIPIAAGFGGGASDATAVLKGLAAVWNLDTSQLVQIAASLGSDCAFFLNGGTALGEERGEKLTELSAPPTSLHFEIIDTGIQILAKDAYAVCDLRRCGKNISKTDALIKGLYRRDNKAILENLHNDFEEFLYDRYPRLGGKKTNCNKNFRRAKFCLRGLEARLCG